MSRARTLLLVGLGLVAIACTPTYTTEEGFFGCADGGGCPPGTTCRDDGRCHAGTATAGEACGDGVAPFCEVGLSCLTGTGGGLMALDENRFCGTACPGGDDDCPTDTQCIGGECLVQCEDGDQCSGDAECRFPTFAIMEGIDVEAPICGVYDEMDLEGRIPCSSPMNCRPPGFCLSDSESDDGLCSFRCETSAHCAMGGVCLMVGMPPDWGQCFRPCMDDGDCGGAGLTCESTGLPGPIDTVCMPTAWAGQLMTITFDLMTGMPPDMPGMMP